MPTITTSFKIDEDSWKRLKIAAIERGITTADALARAIDLWLDSPGIVKGPPKGGLRLREPELISVEEAERNG